MLTNALLPIAFGAVGMIAAFLIYANILKTPSGEGRVKEIADEIHLGAMDQYTKRVEPKAHKLPYKLSRSEVAFYNANKDNPAMDFALSFCEPAD